mmetsp:Transcript_62556/g.185012  ORF Transcript_62556/g.185012 Transcript_62556/m.185012 type:complete len:111 (-) Transcript_62556:1435-1767(-)
MVNQSFLPLFSDSGALRKAFQNNMIIRVGKGCLSMAVHSISCWQNRLQCFGSVQFLKKVHKLILWSRAEAAAKNSRCADGSALYESCHSRLSLARMPLPCFSALSTLGRI